MMQVKVEWDHHEVVFSETLGEHVYIGTVHRMMMVDADEAADINEGDVLAVCHGEQE